MTFPQKAIEKTVCPGPINTRQTKPVASVSDKLKYAAGTGRIDSLNNMLDLGLFAPASLSEALFHAVTGKHVATVRALLSHGANVHACRGEQTVLNCLFDRLDSKEDLEVLAVLLEHIDRRCSDGRFNHYESQRYPVVTVSNNEGMTIVRKLLQSIDIDGVPCEEITTKALHHGLLESEPSLTPAAIHRLLFMGADLNLKLGEDQAFALQLAAQLNLAETMKLLIQLGADVHLTDAQGTSALHVAAYNLNVDAIRILLKAGALHDEPNHVGATAQFLYITAAQIEFDRRFPKRHTAKNVFNYQGRIWKAAQNLLFGLSPLEAEDPMHVTWEPADRECYRKLPMPYAEIPRRIHSAPR